MEKLNILVVDDEPGIRSGISRILRNFTVDYPFMDNSIGFDVIEAGTGEEAIEILNDTKADIILLDNKLPGMSGVEVLEHITKGNCNCLVVMITSYASLDVAIKATKNGAFDFVPKPFTPQELKSSLENITKHLFLKRMTKKMHKEGKQVRFQFLSVLSHEMKAPLNAVEGYLDMMKEKKNGNNIDDYDDMIDRSLVRIQGMRNLIMDMLDLTRIESGKKKREMKLENLTDVVKNAIDTMIPYSIQRDVKIHFEHKGNLEMIIDADEMGIIFNNLISNAIKYNKEHGDVYCRLFGEDDKIVIEVEDTGIGMTSADISKLFKEFVRIKSSKTRHISGSGLGLSIVKKLVKLYNGKIAVESVPEKGTTFKIVIKK
jgi:two-component system, sensor histidine kinase and response regulator